MTHTANGTFEVTMTPGKADDAEDKDAFARMRISKQWSGGLEGTSAGLMLYTGSPAQGSAAYVALEHVQGVLAGRSGSFALVHRGIMDRGEDRLEVTVAPGSGTAQLADLAGAMTIRREGGRHFYDFEYTLPTEP